jgi:hypothetical protein
MNIDITPTDGYPHMYDYLNNAVGVGSNPLVIIIFTFVIIVYYILFSYLGITGGSVENVVVKQSTGVRILEIFMWGIFIFLIMINGLQYFFGIDIKTGIKNIFSPVPEVDITVTSPELVEEDGNAGIPEITIDPQVFHVSDNVYTYNDAKALCGAYGARLANIDEVQNAWKNGAEWCGYGWSDDQMILYPTQEKTWEKLQKIPGHKHDCGRPGVNGGYVANPKARFGANCYGYKPKITDLEKKKMDSASIFPKTEKERRFERKVKKYRNKLSNILISPFNYDKWSEI